MLRRKDSLADKAARLQTIKLLVPSLTLVQIQLFSISESPPTTATTIKLRTQLYQVPRPGSP